MDAKSEGLAWNDIKLKYFPNKTGNACRKRHERLMQKLRTTDWDEARIRRVTNAYTTSGARERFWKEIARRVDEDRWEDVERVVRRPGLTWNTLSANRTHQCFQQGLKNLRNTNASQSRGRSRASSGNVEYVQTPSTGGEFDAKSYEHDDSGFAEGLAVGSRRSSHGHGHSHGHSQSISLPVSGVQALSGLDFLGDQHQHQQAMIRPTHQRQMSHQQLSLYQ